MNWDLIAYLGIFGALTCGALILFTRWIWREADARITRLLAEALTRPPHDRYRTIDAEYRALVLAEHNRDHD